MTVYIAKFTSKFSWQTLTPPGRPLRLCLPRLSRSKDQQLNNYCLNQINNDIEVAHPLSGPPSTWLHVVELEFGNVGFWGDGKTEVIGEKLFGAKGRTNRKLKPLVALTPGLESVSHWWKASALSTAPPLFPSFSVLRSCISSWRNAIIMEKGAPCLSLHLSCPAVFNGNMQPMHFPTPWTPNIILPAVSHQRFRLSCSSFAFSRRYLTQVTFRF